MPQARDVNKNVKTGEINQRTRNKTKIILRITRKLIRMIKAERLIYDCNLEQELKLKAINVMGKTKDLPL